jgi:CheY-like chemotaxis protein
LRVRRRIAILPRVNDFKATVLVVDDQAELRELVGHLLRDEGYQVYEAEHGKAALDILEQVAAPCVMLLDLMMPVMDGPKLLRELEQRGWLKHLEVLVVTANLRPQVGNRRVLAKPFHIEDLLAAVKEQAARLRLRSPAPFALVG